MSLERKAVVVVGATGVVGLGIVRKYLDAGATVIGVSRQEGNLAKLKGTLKIGAKDAFRGVVGEFKDETSAAAAKSAIMASAGGPIDHVVTVQGFGPYAKAPTEAPISGLRETLDDGFFNNLLAAKALLPGMKGREGSSFTLVSGGLAHIPPPVISLWFSTIKNAAINALNHALAAETANDKVRVNTICIHFPVAPIGGGKNQFGMDAEGDTLRLAPAFLGVARGAQKGQLLCLNSWADADSLAR